ncbi:DNA binding protein, partial [Tulasnella sp. 427]
KRYATFKLYYTPDTPDEYEPPGFVGVDPEDARLYFATHHCEEVPDREVYGTLETGHHSVDLKVATLTHCIPSTDLTMDVDREERKAEIFEQAEDALNRNVIWSAEVDVQALKDAKDTVDSVVVESSVDVGPIGTRMRDGVVKLQEGGGVKTYVGAPSIRPADLEAFNDRDLTPGDVNTQPIQVVSSRATSPAGLAASRVTDTLQQADDIVRTLADGDDTEMLDADTQMPSARDRCALPDQPIGMDIDSRSLPRSTTPPSKPNQEPSSRTLRSTSVRKTSPAPPCSCGGKSDKRDPEIVCETCGGLYHICCMGYLGLDDSRIPRAFECFVCRLDRCPRAKMLPSDTRVEVENNWRALCLFRRALKVVRDGPVPPTALALSKRLACPNNLGQQMKKRLEDEGFIGPEVVETVDVFEESAPPKGKKKAKKPAKTAKGKLVIIWTEESKKRFMRYFKPGGTYERAIYNFEPSATREPSTPKAPRGEASKAPGAAPRVSREPLLPRQETTDLLLGRDTVDDAPLEDIFSPTSNARKRSHSAAKPVTYASRKKLKMSLATGAMNMEDPATDVKRLPSCTDSTVLRYIIALNDAGYIDGPSTCTISTAERLRRLEHHQAAWRDLNWSRTDSYDIDHRTGTYELYGGVYAQGLESTIDATSDGTRGLELIEFPSALRNQPEGHRWRIPDFGFDVKDFGMDPDKDLLILMRKPPGPSAKIRNPPLEVHLVCLRDPDARPHPLAQHPVLFYQPHVWNRRYYYWIQVVGDLLGVMFRPEVRNQDDAMAHELLDELIVWKWKTGEQVTRIRCDPGFEAGSFSFLTNEVILIPCVKDDIVPELRLYQLPRKTSTASTKDSASNSQASTLLAIFRFPEFIRSVRACGIVCRTDPSPWVPEPRRPADVHDAFESSERDHDVPVWPAHGAAPFAPHPSSRLVVISMDIVTMVRWPGWGILPNVEGDMGQQPMGRKHTFFTRAESLIEAWKMASEKLEGEGVADVPWEDWGPAGTRMLGEGTDPSAVCYVYGL